MFTNFFVLNGVEDAEFKIISKMIKKVFNSFIDSLTHDQRQVYQSITSWIRSNTAAPSEGVGQTNRNILVVYGPGNTGKTAFCRNIFQGLGDSYRSLSFTPSAIGRAEIDHLSVLEFYDEVCKDDTNIFFQFANFEKERSSLFTASTPPKAITFIMASSANISGFPTALQYEKWSQQKGNAKQYASYDDFVGQAQRRFTMVEFRDLTTFSLPFIRFFDDQQAFISAQNTLQTNRSGSRFMELIQELPEWEAISPDASALFDHYNTPNKWDRRVLITGQDTFLDDKISFYSDPVSKMGISFASIIKELFWGYIWGQGLISQENDN